MIYKILYRRLKIGRAPQSIGWTYVFRKG